MSILLWARPTPHTFMAVELAFVFSHALVWVLIEQHCEHSSD